MGYEYVRFQRGSQAAYDALKKAGRLDPNTLYFIYDDTNNSVGALYMGTRIISGGDITIASASLDDLADVIISETGENSFLVKNAAGNWVSKSLEDVIDLITSDIQVNDLDGDNSSIIIVDGKISISGFSSAAPGTQLSKDENGKVIWIEPPVIPEVDLSNYSTTNELIVGLDNGARLLTSEESKKLEALVLENGEIGISGVVNASNVQELYSNVVKIVTQSGSYEYDKEQKPLLNIQPGAEINIINDASDEFIIDENRKLSINLIDASKVTNLGSNLEFVAITNQVSENKNNILTITTATDQLSKDVEELKKILAWKEL